MECGGCPRGCCWEKVGSIWVLLKRCNDLRFWKDLLVCCPEASVGSGGW